MLTCVSRRLTAAFAMALALFRFILPPANPFITLQVHAILEQCAALCASVDIPAKPGFRTCGRCTGDGTRHLWIRPQTTQGAAVRASRRAASQLARPLFIERGPWTGGALESASAAASAARASPAASCTSASAAATASLAARPASPLDSARDRNNQVICSGNWLQWCVCLGISSCLAGVSAPGHGNPKP